jgi:hypothetical protein
MYNRHIAAFVRKLVIPAAALASLASVTLLQAVEPAAAKPMNHCQLRHSFCAERCIMKSDTMAQGNACLRRTCDHQFKSCSKSIGDNRGPGDASGPPIGWVRPKGRRPHLDSTPRVTAPAGSILDSGIVLGTSGPAATGSPAGGGRPAAAPSAPPVIIR